MRVFVFKIKSKHISHVRYWDIEHLFISPKLVVQYIHDRARTKLT